MGEKHKEFDPLANPVALRPHLLLEGLVSMKSNSELGLKVWRQTGPGSDSPFDLLSFEKRGGLVSILMGPDCVEIPNLPLHSEPRANTRQ